MVYTIALVDIKHRCNSERNRLIAQISATVLDGLQTHCEIHVTLKMFSKPMFWLYLSRYSYSNKS